MKPKDWLGLRTVGTMAFQHFKFLMSVNCIVHAVRAIPQNAFGQPNLGDPFYNTSGKICVEAWLEPVSGSHHRTKDFGLKVLQGFRV